MKQWHVWHNNCTNPVICIVFNFQHSFFYYFLTHGPLRLLLSPSAHSHYDLTFPLQASIIISEDTNVYDQPAAWRCIFCALRFNYVLLLVVVASFLRVAYNEEVEQNFYHKQGREKKPKYEHRDVLHICPSMEFMLERWVVGGEKVLTMKRQTTFNMQWIYYSPVCFYSEYF